ncbi:MAG: hypothetical protein FD180_2748 [Planctomycetota bacterium]|nr:MAG: hypothetical protein FD180_2748 [Planctomycetota bacterium]
MKALLPVAMVLAAAACAAAAWFAPVRNDIAGRRSRVDDAGQPTTAKPLSAMTEADRAEVEGLVKRLGELDAKLDRHQEISSGEWNALLSDLTRENARRTVEGDRLASVVNAAGGKPIEAQIEDLMDETARKRVKGMLKGWIDTESNALKTHLGLAGSQAAAVDQLVADILKEEEEKLAQGDAGDNMIGWRPDIMASARDKLKDRIDPLLTGEQKPKAQEWFKSTDWGRAWREGQKKGSETK